MKLENSVAVITGASRGIGHCLSRSLIEKGGKVAGLARDRERLDEVRSELGESFLPIVCDVRDAAAVDAATKQVMETWGQVDILVNNAGIGHFGPVAELDKERWDEMIDTNITGTYHLVHALVPHLRSGGGGHVVNVASIAGKVGNPNLSGYNASKFAVRGFSEALFQELREDGIKVTAVYPGSVQTSFSSIRQRSTTKNKLTPEEVAETIVFCLERSDNFLIDEITFRPLKPKG